MSINVETRPDKVIGEIVLVYGQECSPTDSPPFSKIARLLEGSPRPKRPPRRATEVREDILDIQELRDALDEDDFSDYRAFRKNDLDM